MQVMSVSARLERLPDDTERSNGRTVPPMTEDTALGVEERAELERLRAEVASLRAQAQGGGAKASRPWWTMALRV